MHHVPVPGMVSDLDDRSDATSMVAHCGTEVGNATSANASSSMTARDVNSSSVSLAPSSCPESFIASPHITIDAQSPTPSVLQLDHEHDVDSSATSITPELSTSTTPEPVVTNNGEEEDSWLTGAHHDGCNCILCRMVKDPAFAKYLDRRPNGGRSAASIPPPIWTENIGRMVSRGHVDVDDDHHPCELVESTRASRVAAPPAARIPATPSGPNTTDVVPTGVSSSTTPEHVSNFGANRPRDQEDDGGRICDYFLSSPEGSEHGGSIDEEEEMRYLDEAVGLSIISERTEIEDTQPSIEESGPADIKVNSTDPTTTRPEFAPGNKATCSTPNSSFKDGMSIIESSFTSDDAESVSPDSSIVIRLGEAKLGAN